MGTIKTLKVQKITYNNTKLYIRKATAMDDKKYTLEEIHYMLGDMNGLFPETLYLFYQTIALHPNYIIDKIIKDIFFYEAKVAAGGYFSFKDFLKIGKKL